MEVSLMYQFADDMHTCITYKCFKKTKPSFAIFNGDIYALDAFVSLAKSKV